MSRHDNTMGRLSNENIRLQAENLALRSKVEQRHVDAAESLVKKGIEIARDTGMAVSDVLGSILSVASKVNYMEWQQKQREKQDGQQDAET